MSQYLPTGEFKWEEDLSVFTEEYLMNLDDEERRGYFLQVTTSHIRLIL